VKQVKANQSKSKAARQHHDKHDATRLHPISHFIQASKVPKSWARVPFHPFQISARMVTAEMTSTVRTCIA
jgi:hypothetical protein